MKKARLYFILLWLVSLLLIVTACSDKSIDKTNQEFLEKQVSGEENTESLFNTLQFIEAFPGLPEFSRPLALFEIPNGSRWMLLVLQGHYKIPEDNPFADGLHGQPEIWAWGLRNPWRMNFDTEGNLWVGDVGQNRIEEINIVEKGHNYGWNTQTS